MNDRVTIVALGDSTTAGTPGFAQPGRVRRRRAAATEQCQYAYWLMQAHPEWACATAG